jgi:hypothetical protein
MSGGLAGIRRVGDWSVEYGIFDKNHIAKIGPWSVE